MGMGKNGCALSLTAITVIIVVNLCIDSTLANADNAWEQWKVKHEKIYSSQLEEKIRRVIWEKHFHSINEHNAKQTTLKLGINYTGDQVIRTNLLGRLEDTNVSSKNGKKGLPDQWDWRARGVVTPVRNQGAGSAVPLVATDCVETYHTVKTGKRLSLSDRQVIECCPHNADLVFGCIHELGGLCLAADYKSGPGGTCNMASCKPVVQIQGGKKVIAKNETDLQVSVLKTPVFAMIDASRAGFRNYRSGVYSDPGCSQTRLNHVVQVVGYAARAWILKNSWGTHWGDRGYIYMARNHDNMCGIASNAYYPF